MRTFSEEKEAKQAPYYYVMTYSVRLMLALALAPAPTLRFTPAPATGPSHLRTLFLTYTQHRVTPFVVSWSSQQLNYLNRVAHMTIQLKANQR